MNNRIITALWVVLSIIQFQVLAWAGWEEATAAYDRGDYATALRELGPLVEQGDASAQFSLGVMYYNGQGVPQDYVKAAELFRKVGFGLISGDPLYLLGFMYYNGQGVPQDFVKAADWYQSAAYQLGHAQAQYELGLMYYKGLGVLMDHDKAFRLFRKAARQGQTDAPYHLGYIYETGKGAPQDSAQAYAWYNISAAQGYAAAVSQRDSVAAKMTPSQLEQAQQLSREYFEKYVVPFRPEE